MKMKKGIYVLLMILPFLMVGIAWYYLPDQIPAHYGIDNQVDRWGSKYETLLVPMITMIFGLFMLLLAKHAGKKDLSGNNAKLVDITSILLLVMLNMMNAYFLYTALSQVTDLDTVSVDIYTLVCACLGVLLIIMGNLMPKTKMNGAIGFRCGWSMKNRITWRKCNFFAGVTSLLCGLILLVSCFFLQGVYMICFMLVLMLMMLLVDMVYAHHIAKNF